MQAHCFSVMLLHRTIEPTYLQVNAQYGNLAVRKMPLLGYAQKGHAFVLREAANGAALTPLTGYANKVLCQAGNGAALVLEEEEKPSLGVLSIVLSAARDVAPVLFYTPFACCFGVTKVFGYIFLLIWADSIVARARALISLMKGSACDIKDSHHIDRKIAAIRLLREARSYHITHVIYARPGIGKTELIKEAIRLEQGGGILHIPVELTNGWDNMKLVIYDALGSFPRLWSKFLGNDSAERPDECFKFLREATEAYYKITGKKALIIFEDSGKWLDEKYEKMLNNLAKRFTVADIVLLGAVPRILECNDHVPPLDEDEILSLVTRRFNISHQIAEDIIRFIGCYDLSKIIDFAEAVSSGTSWEEMKGWLSVGMSYKFVDAGLYEPWGRKLLATMLNKGGLEILEFTYLAEKYDPNVINLAKSGIFVYKDHGDKLDFASGAARELAMDMVSSKLFLSELNELD